MYLTIHVYCTLFITITIIMKLIQGRVQGNRIRDVMCDIAGRIREVKICRGNQNATFPIFDCLRFSFDYFILLFRTNAGRFLQNNTYRV